MKDYIIILLLLIVFLLVSFKKNRQHIFITYGCDKYNRSKQRIEKEVKATKMFDRFRAYEPSIVKDILHSYSAKETLEVMKLPRGGGYWIWKPIIIQDTLQSMNDGDILVYADAGCNVRNNKKEIVKTINSILKDKYGISHCGTCGGYRVELNRMDVVKHYIEEKYIEAFFATNNGIEYEANRIIIRKCPASIKFISQWVDAAINHPDFFTDKQSSIPNHPKFKEHRHDQSIYNCLAFNFGIEGKTCDFKEWLIASRIRV